MSERFPFQMTITADVVKRDPDRSARWICHTPWYVPRSKCMYAIARQEKHQQHQQEQIEVLFSRHLNSTTSDVEIRTGCRAGFYL